MTVQNKKADVENFLVENISNDVVKRSTQQVFEGMVNLDTLGDLCSDITADIVSDLREASFMTKNLELSKAQREKLEEDIPGIIMSAKNRYVSKIKSDERLKEIIRIVESNLSGIIEELLSAIAEEINRGAILNSIAVSADTKNPNHNKIELNHSKRSGDITIPTRGIFLSTNCIDIILKSIKIEKTQTEEEKKDEGN